MTAIGPAARLVAVAACVVIGTSCGGGASVPTGPSGSGSRSGTWLGTLIDMNNVPATIRLTIEEYQIDAARSLVSGTWSAVYENPARSGSGSITGTITGTDGALLLSPSVTASCGGPFPVPPGTYTAPILTVSDASIRGPYSQALCSSTITGTLALAKQ